MLPHTIVDQPQQTVNLTDICPNNSNSAPSTLPNNGTMVVGTSFQRCVSFVSAIERKLIDLTGQLTTYGESLVQNDTIIIITKTVVQPRIPSFLRLVIAIFLYFLRNFRKGNKASEELAQDVEKSPECITMKSSLWHVITQIIYRKMYRCQPVIFSIQLSSMIIFRQELSLAIFTLIGDCDTVVNLQYFLRFYEQLDSIRGLAQWLPHHLYWLFGGSRLAITLQSFTEKAENWLKLIRSYIHEENIEVQFMRSLSQKRKDKENDLLERYMELVVEARKVDGTDNIKKLAAEIFGYLTTLERKAFEEKVASLIIVDGKLQGSILTHVIEVIRMEFHFVEVNSMTTKTMTADDSKRGRYYIQSLQKLMNKCPYNGDESCNCKKCQCIRRNRESAKNSQQKKREAMEQIGPLNERIRELEGRNSQLEKENIFLKGLLASFNHHPNFYSLIRQSIESLSKSINNH